MLFLYTTNTIPVFPEEFHEDVLVPCLSTVSPAGLPRTIHKYMAPED